MNFIRTIQDLWNHDENREYHRYIDTLTKEKLSKHFQDSKHEFYRTDISKLLKYGFLQVEDFPTNFDELNLNIQGKCVHCDTVKNTSVMCKTHNICGKCCYVKDIEYIQRETGAAYLIAIEAYNQHQGNIKKILDHIQNYADYGLLYDPGPFAWKKLFEKEDQ